MQLLIVDDERQILSLLVQFLSRAGHSALVAESVATAAKLVQSPELRIDAAVIDLSLPDGSGEDIARSILELHPSVKVVIATGYSYEPPNELKGRILVLQNPFLPRALLNLLASANIH